MATVLDTSGSWSAGDEYRVLDALGLSASEYMVAGLRGCMNAMEDALVVRVLDDLDRYDAAKTAQRTADLANPDGRTLVKADVLEWQASHSGSVGTSRELTDAVAAIRRSFGSCAYVPQDTLAGQTLLLRS